jgi:hypothetical protein
MLPTMSACRRCGADYPQGDGLFCRFCGAAQDITSPRLLEAIAIDTVGDVASPVLPYGVLVPNSYSDVFSTAEDDQPTVRVHLVAGNAPRASACRNLMDMTIAIRNRGPMNVPRVRLTITVERDGRLRVVFEEEGTDNRVAREDLVVPVSDAR